MKINLVKIKIGDTYSYKYKPYTYCCDALKENKCVIFTNEDIVYNNLFAMDIDNIDDSISPQFCISRTETFYDWGDQFEQTDNYPIQFCPHCGEKIEITVTNKLDLTNEYDKISKLRTKLWERYKNSDSKKKSINLRHKIDYLDGQTNYLYKFGQIEEGIIKYEEEN